ncbi:MAG: metalloregulator ArsR/SmtB family transcription factor [Pseudomonadota bacterium]
MTAPLTQPLAGDHAAGAPIDDAPPGDAIAPGVDHVQLAKVAKALSHPARLKIIETVLSRDVCIGCDIVDELGLAASTTSEHLKILKEAGIVVGEIVRPRVCYSVDPDAIRPFLQYVESLSNAKPAKLP